MVLMDVYSKQSHDSCIFPNTDGVDDRRDGREFAIKKFRNGGTFPLSLRPLIAVMSGSGSYQRDSVRGGYSR